MYRPEGTGCVDANGAPSKFDTGIKVLKTGTELQMTCYTDYPYANQWRVVPGPLPCHMGLSDSEAPYMCTEGQSVGKSATDGSVVGQYAGLIFSRPLIVAMSSQGAAGRTWGCVGDPVISWGNTDGFANTQLLVSSGCTGGEPLAKACSISFGSGWFMPALNQMQSIYSKAKTPGNPSGPLTGFLWANPAYYWTSTSNGNGYPGTAQMIGTQYGGVSNAARDNYMYLYYHCARHFGG